MMTRCKFRLNKIDDAGECDGNPQKRYTFGAICDMQDPGEDLAFTKYTPSGTLDVTINNPRVVEALKLDALYYLDITPVEPPATA